MSKTIGIIGGSFDPPHEGHVSMAKLALANNLVDYILIIPCDSHPFSKSLSQFETRFKLCEIAFKNIENLKVLDLEKKLEKPNYTCKTLEFLRNNCFPKNEIKLLIGSDLLEKLDTWYNFEKLLTLCEILVFPRKNYENNKLKNNLKNQKITYLEDFSLPDAQSYLINQALQENPSEKPDGLSEQVYKFIARR